MRNKIKAMLEMQNDFNKVVNPNWIEANYKFTDAIMVESVELLEHYGWKWWKKQTPDDNQCKMELIDIWHFIMSDVMQYNYSHMEKETFMEDSLNTLEDYFASVSRTSTCVNDDMIKNYIRDMVAESSVGSGVMAPFIKLLDVFDISGDELFKMYVGKNTLNKFRQANGYKTGEYIKIWNGKEDNEVLTEILNVLEVESANYADRIYASLEVEYKSISSNN